MQFLRLTCQPFVAEGVKYLASACRTRRFLSARGGIRTPNGLSPNRSQTDPVYRFRHSRVQLAGAVGFEPTMLGRGRINSPLASATHPYPRSEVVVTWPDALARVWPFGL